jgi:thiol-disulfide isomerase/thioredoxin
MSGMVRTLLVLEINLMNKGKTILGAIAALVLVVGLFLANKYWIAPILVRQAQAKGIAAAGNHPMAPEFSLTSISGEKISLDQFKGKVLVVDFWATWCGPCRIEIPGFVELEKRYHDQGLEIIGLSEDEGSDAPQDVADFYKKFSMNYPVALASDGVDQLYGGIIGLPTTFLIGRDGRIYAKHTGTTDISVFEEEIKTLLAAQPGVAVADFKPAIQRADDDIVVKTPAEVKAENNPDVPGVNISALTPAQLAKLKKVLSAENCTCGCNMTVLECRHKDPGCGISRKLAQDALDKITKKSI